MCIMSFVPAGVMELVDVADSKSAASDGMGVRVPLPAPLGMTGFLGFWRTRFFFAFGQFSPVLSKFLQAGLDSGRNADYVVHLHMGGYHRRDLSDAVWRRLEGKLQQRKAACAGTGVTEAA